MGELQSNVGEGRAFLEEKEKEVGSSRSKIEWKVNK